MANCIDSVVQFPHFRLDFLSNRVVMVRIASFDLYFMHIAVNGSGYFAISGILPLEAILPWAICDWSILMTY